MLSFNGYISFRTYSSKNIDNFFPSYHPVIAHYQLRCIVFFVYVYLFLKPKNANEEGNSTRILKLVLHITELPVSEM